MADLEEMHERSKNKESDKDIPENDEFNIERAIESLNMKLDTLNNRLENVETEFQSKIKYDLHKEKIIDDLHRELQEYKNDFIKSLMRPVIIDIIHTIDNITKLIKSHKTNDPSELDPLKLIRQMEGIAGDLEDIISQQGVESYTSDQSEFNSKRQRIIETEITDDIAKDKTISRKVLKGYQCEGKILRQEMVNVYIYKPDSTEPGLIKNEEKES
jgi:molecular chaperone GrpE